MIKPDCLFRDMATIQPYLGRDMTGEKLGEPYELPCRVEQSRKRVSHRSTANGAIHEVIANARAFFAAGTRFEPGTRITVDGIPYSALSVTPMKGLSESHVEVMLL